MRIIDNRRLRLPAGWLENARSVQAEIDNEVKEAAAGYTLWSSLKTELRELSDGKCWYCESREVRSDNAVDHFRPKSLYPWFACDHENFRFSCTFCNSIRKNPETGESAGKGNHFPLIEGERAKTSQERRHESYLLLDPCNPTDVLLLDFKDDGTACPKYPNNAIKKLRAEKSIHYYHLDHPELIEARRQLALDIRNWIEIIDDLNRGSDLESPAVRKTLETLYGNLFRAVDNRSPFSVFAKKMVCGYRNLYWIEEFLEKI